VDLRKEEWRKDLSKSYDLSLDAGAVEVAATSVSDGCEVILSCGSASTGDGSPRRR
jgi:hypothetical protein